MAKKKNKKKVSRKPKAKKRKPQPIKYAAPTDLLSAVGLASTGTAWAVEEFGSEIPQEIASELDDMNCRLNEIYSDLEDGTYDKDEEE
jgi:hypothetical protein